MGKRRRCNDKLPHSEHEWVDGEPMRGYQRRPTSGWRLSRTTYWCRGIEKVTGDD